MSFFEEIKRRNVVRVGIAYVVIGWVLAQLAEFAFENFGAPDWALKSFVVVLLLGLPLALFFAWAFEMTPDGIKREKDVDRSQSITPHTGRKLDFIIIGVLVVAVGALLTDRFMVEPEPVSEPVETAAPETVATDIEIVTTGKSIAVLPFVNMSDDKDYFADGLSEELLNLLAKTPGLKVAGRTSSFAFKGKQEDLRAIGAALGVATVLEGSVRRSGDRLRITAQLINVDDGFHLWSETYDRQMADIFDIQDDVANSITGALRLQLAPGSDKPTDNAEAYALYVEALPYIANNDDPNVLEIVTELLDSAIALDPTFAKAYEAKALTYWMTAGETTNAQTAAQQIRTSSEKALELDPSLVLARFYAETAVEWEWESEFDAVGRALAAAPTDFNILRAWCYDLMVAGYLQEALRCTDKLIELEPLSPLSHWRAAMDYSALGRRREARDAWQRALNVSEGTTYAIDEVLDSIVAGEFDAASAEFAAQDWEMYAWNAESIQQVLTWAASGDDASARTWIRDQADGATNFQDANNTYYWYLVLGYVDEYWAEIERIGRAKNYAWTNTEFLVQYGIAFPTTGFRSHPSFTRYARETGLTDLWDDRGAPDFCSKDSGNWVCE
jgi:TolB-like protein